jgi:hypothetical protein
MNPIAMTPANTIQLAPLGPLPYAWAAYFLNAKTPFDAWQMGCSLIVMLGTANQQDCSISPWPTGCKMPV